MDTKKEAKKYLNKYFKAQYLNENDNEFKSLVRLLNKAVKQVKNCNTPLVTKCALPKRKPSVCRHCKSDDIYFDMDAGTWVCNECNQKAN